MELAGSRQPACSSGPVQSKKSYLSIQSRTDTYIEAVSAGAVGMPRGAFKPHGLTANFGVCRDPSAAHHLVLAWLALARADKAARRAAAVRRSIRATACGIAPARPATA